MAAAKIATLAIRTLAKPIATQIKHQATSHETFRGFCISLAQTMHRSEVALRSNLLSSSNSKGERPKVRPLNEAKAVTNGANALAEGFLFALATALILGESYRGSRSRAKQRDRTEEGMEELRLLVQALSEKQGVPFDELKRRADELHPPEEEREMEEDGQQTRDEHHAKAERRLREDNTRLQHAVSVLLRLALKSGWIEGAEALQLQQVMDGQEEHPSRSSQTEERAPSESNMQSSPILHKVAEERAKSIANGVRFGNEGQQSASLEDLLHQAGVGRPDG